MTPRTCTWLHCDRRATVEQTTWDGSIWADLCGNHDKKLHEAYDKMDYKNLFDYWVKAQGGPRAASKRMVPKTKTKVRR